MRAQGTEFSDPKRYQTAFDTLSLYSTRVDDIFILVRILAEVRYAEALLMNGLMEESLSWFALATEHISVLHQLPEGSVLCGSVPVLNSVHLVINADDKLEKCVFNIGGYDKNLLFDKIRGDKRFIGFMESLGKFFPQQKSRSWINEKGCDALDTKWEMLLNEASKEADKLFDGNVVVMLTAKGSVICVPFQDLSSSVNTESAIKALLEIKKNEDAKIDRLICMWHDGSIDLPSYAFREALLSVNRTNFSTKILLNGLTGYIVKTVMVTMPKGYEA